MNGLLLALWVFICCPLIGYGIYRFYWHMEYRTHPWRYRGALPRPDNYESLPRWGEWDYIKRAVKGQER